MKLTKSQLKQIIEEELQNVLNEYGVAMGPLQDFEKVFKPILSNFMENYKKLNKIQHLDELNPSQWERLIDDMAKGSTRAINATISKMKKPDTPDAPTQFQRKGFSKAGVLGDPRSRGAGGPRWKHVPK
tara:strand:- start:108 stop:494 length:387 start_codon:yes stop_codon:yes gene_type:complete